MCSTHVWKILGFNEHDYTIHVLHSGKITRGICIPIILIDMLYKSVQSIHQYFRFSEKKLSISRFHSWDRSQMKGLVILYSIGVLQIFRFAYFWRNNGFFKFYDVVSRKLCEMETKVGLVDLSTYEIWIFSTKMNYKVSLQLNNIVKIRKKWRTNC